MYVHISQIINGYINSYICIDIRPMPPFLVVLELLLKYVIRVPILLSIYVSCQAEIINLFS